MEKKDEYFKQLLSIKFELEKFALFLTRNRESARELVSEVILLGFDSFVNLKKESSFKSYLFTICLRTFYQHKRKNKKFVSYDENEISGFYSGLKTDELYDLGMLFIAIDKLKNIEKEVLTLAELMGYKHKEIAEILHISESNVKVTVFRAKNKLKELLVDNK